MPAARARVRLMIINARGRAVAEAPISARADRRRARFRAKPPHPAHDDDAVTLRTIVTKDVIDRRFPTCGLRRR